MKQKDGDRPCRHRLHRPWQWTRPGAASIYSGTTRPVPLTTRSWLFFAEFLCATGVYETWVKSCPLAHISPNAPTKQDVLGTWLLAILAGHNRYAHITALRADAVSPQIFGMIKIISEDALRRALARLSAEQSRDWLVPQCSRRPNFDPPWGVRTISWTGQTAIPRLVRCSAGLRKPSDILIRVSLYHRM